MCFTKDLYSHTMTCINHRRPELVPYIMSTGINFGADMVDDGWGGCVR